MLTWNILDFVISGMAQFLDFDFDSDEDFEDSNQQGREGLLFFLLQLEELFIFRKNVWHLILTRFSFWSGKILYHDKDAICFCQLVSYIISRRGESW